MVKRCFVMNCRTNCKSERKNNKISLFKAPNDETLLEKWREVVPLRDRELTSKDCICEKHFEKQYVMPRFQQSRFGDYYEDHIRPKLARNAIPTIFVEDSKEKTSSQFKVLNDSNRLLTNIFKLNLPHVEVNDNDTVHICYKCLLGKCNIHIIFH